MWERTKRLLQMIQEVNCQGIQILSCHFCITHNSRFSKLPEVKIIFRFEGKKEIPTSDKNV